MEFVRRGSGAAVGVRGLHHDAAFSQPHAAGEQGPTRLPLRGLQRGGRKAGQGPPPPNPHGHDGPGAHRRPVALEQRPTPRSAVSETASSTASSPNSVVNLMIGFIATDEVSLKGSPTVSPTTVAACSSVPFCFSTVSTTFLALSQAPPALAMKIAWNS